MGHKRSAYILFVLIDRVDLAAMHLYYKDARKFALLGKVFGFKPDSNKNQLLASLWTRRHYSKGSAVYSEGDKCDFLGVISEGNLGLCQSYKTLASKQNESQISEKWEKDFKPLKVNKSGSLALNRSKSPTQSVGNSIPICLIGPEEIICEQVMIGNKDHSCTAIVTSDHLEMFTIARRNLEKVKSVLREDKTFDRFMSLCQQKSQLIQQRLKVLEEPDEEVKRIRDKYRPTFKLNKYAKANIFESKYKVNGQMLTE